MKLFDRKYELKIDNIVITDLHVAFSVERTLRKTPNSLKLQVYNLSEATRNKLSEKEDIPISLKVGYRENIDAVFSGQIRTIAHSRQGPDIVTDIEARDSGSKYTKARINSSYPPGIALRDVLRDLVNALEIGQGNLRDIQDLPLEDGSRTFEKGLVLSGQVHRELTDILRAMGIRWSIQNGVFQAVKRGGFLNNTAILLNEETGLIGDPVKDNKKTIIAVSLINPGLYPGRLVRLESFTIKGDFTIRSVVFEGDNFGGSFYANLELRP